MNSDMHVLANHGLNTTNIELLATDIATRFGATVVYGTENHYADFVAKGQTGSGQRFMRLCDLREPGDDAGILVYELYDVPGTGTYNIWIFRDCFQADADFGTGMYSTFAGYFTAQPTHWQVITAFRQMVQAEAQLLGGNTAIYYAEEGDASFAAYDAEEKPFATVLKNVQALGNKAVTIDDWLQNMPPLSKKVQAFIDKFVCWETPTTPL